MTVLDHFSRAVTRSVPFRKQPTTAELCAVLDSAVHKARRKPRHIASDQGSQFQGTYKAWCERNRVKPRFGAIWEARQHCGH